MASLFLFVWTNKKIGNPPVLFKQKDKVQSVLLRSLAPSFSDAELGVMFAKKLVVT